MKKVIAILLLIALLVGPGLQAQNARKVQPRIWQDSTGQFRVSAVLVRIKGDQVVLRRTNNQEITVTLAKLSTADRQYVQKRLAALRKQIKQNTVPPVVLRNAVGDRDWSKVFGAATEQEAANIVKKSASQGLQSQFGDALGAFFRTRSTLANGNFQQGSRAAKLYKAIQSGATSFERNPVGEILSHRPYLQQLYQSSGLNKVAAEQATNFIGDTVGNRQYLSQNPRTASIVRAVQGWETGDAIMARAADIALQRTFSSMKTIKEKTRDRQNIKNIVLRIYPSLWQNVTANDRNSSANWVKFVNGYTRPVLKDHGLSDAQIDELMPSFAASIVKEGNWYAERSGFKNFNQAIQVNGGQAILWQRRP